MKDTFQNFTGAVLYKEIADSFYKLRNEEKKDEDEEEEKEEEEAEEEEEEEELHRVS